MRDGRVRKEALEDEKTWAREKAAVILGQIGEPAKEAVPALIKEVRDKKSQKNSQEY